MLLHYPSFFKLHSAAEPGSSRIQDRYDRIYPGLILQTETDIGWQAEEAGKEQEKADIEQEESSGIGHQEEETGSEQEERSDIGRENAGNRQTEADTVVSSRLVPNKGYWSIGMARTGPGSGDHRRRYTVDGQRR